MQASPTEPTLVAMHHLALTVTDLEASVSWYERVLGLERAMDVAHHDARSEGYGVLLVHPTSRLMLVLHHHEANDGTPFHESRTGLDHAGLLVGSLEELEAWRARFLEMGVRHSPIAQIQDHHVAVLVFRDPDDIQLELVAPLTA